MKIIRNTRPTRYRPPQADQASSNIHKPQKERKQEFFQRTDAFCKTLIDEIQAGHDPDRLKDMMKFFSSKFTSWSACNILGLYLQKPNIHRPITIREAKNLQHTVKPGVRPASILVPCVARSQPEPITKEDEPRADVLTKPSPSDTSDEVQKPEEEQPKAATRLYFKCVDCVVDLGYETDGPELLESEGANRHESEMVLAALKQYAATAGISIVDDMRLGASAGIAGLRKDGEDVVRVVGISNVLSPDAQLVTGVHEIAHQLLHIANPKEEGSQQEDGKKLGNKAKELQAEAIAYVVSQHFDIPSDYSSTYLKQWGVTPRDIMDNLRTIAKVAREIVQGITREISLGVEVPMEPAEEIVEIDERTYEQQFHADTVTIWQRREEDFQVPSAFDSSEYVKVAVVSDSNISEAFGITQSIEGRWQSSDDPRVSVIEKKSRSSSVGDVAECAGEFFVVTHSGFEQIPAVEETQSIKV